MHVFRGRSGKHSFSRSILVGAGLFIAALLVSLSACVRHVSPALVAQHHTPPTAQSPNAPRWTERIDDEATWRALSTRPENEVFARTETAKFLIDLADNRHLYFPDTHRWPIHFDFARNFLNTHANPIEDHYAFNIREYRRPERRFVLGSLVHYLDGDLWTLELISGDTLDGERILAAFEQIRAAVYFGERLRFRPLSELHEESIAQVSDRLPTIEREAVFAGLRYEPITSGIAFGYVRLVHGALDVGSISPTDILVTADVPEDLPVCAALVTSKLQAPLAHVAVLSRNRGTPDMALRDAITNPSFASLEGQLVRLDVGPQDYTITRASMEDATRHWEAIRPRPADIAAPDPSVTELVDVCSVNSSHVASVGAKAAQLGDVCEIFPNATPGGFVIPVNHYLAHLHSAHVFDAIPAMLTDVQFVNERAVRAERLSELRHTIETASIDPRLIARVRAKLASFPGVRTIFRSSTNAEDLAGFNGAGLYESLAVPARPTDADIARAIRSVWASVWTLRGVEERNWYRIDHSRVAMAILVQPFVEPTIGGGVAVTANPFNEARPAVFINVQAGGSVTGAHGDELPEQHLVYTYSGTYEPEVLSRSTITNGATILPEADVLELTHTLTTLHTNLVPRYANNANALDVEFFVRTDHTIIIVQARPYRVVYTEGQRWIY
jgi:hypothetical protein